MRKLSTSKTKINSTKSRKSRSLQRGLLCFPKNWANLLALVLALVITFILYQRLGRDYLFDWDEGIYAELGSEMLQSGNYLIPTWNHEPWLEKPPGIAWVTAGSMTLFGKNSFGARAFMPLFALISLLSIYFIGKKLDRPVTGLISMSLLAYFYLFLSRARGVNTDGPMLAAIISSVALILYRAPPIILAFAISIGVMFKGPAALLSIIIALPLFFSKSKRYLLLTTFYLLLFILPWHLYAYSKYGEAFLTPYLKEQLLHRMSTPIEFHIENRYYYFTYLYENLKAGVLFVAALGATLLFREFLVSKQKIKHLKLLLPIWWALIVLAIITVTKTRLFWYVLPTYPAIAILCAYAITYFLKGKRVQPILFILTIGIIIQSLIAVTQSVELSKVHVDTPDRILMAEHLKTLPEIKTLYVYVIQIERVFMDIMPPEQRISSTFRYGGMPNLPFYLEKPVYYFYTKDEMQKFWENAETHPYAIFTKADSRDIPPYSDVLYETADFIAVKRGDMYVTIRDLKRSKLR